MRPVLVADDGHSLERRGMTGHERDGELGGRVGEDARCVGGPDASCSYGVEVDVVVADAEVRDHLQ
jgi:hypothetical protein